MEVEADVALRDAQILNFWLFSSLSNELLEKRVDELACLGLYVSLDVKLSEGLLDALFAENIGELSVNVHVEIDVLSLQYSWDGLLWLNRRRLRLILKDSL